jgi:hypothetical protein
MSKPRDENQIAHTVLRVLLYTEPRAGESPHQRIRRANGVQYGADFGKLAHVGGQASKDKHPMWLRQLYGYKGAAIQQANAKKRRDN